MPGVVTIGFSNFFPGMWKSKPYISYRRPPRNALTSVSKTPCMLTTEKVFDYSSAFKKIRMGEIIDLAASK